MTYIIKYKPAMKCLSALLIPVWVLMPFLSRAQYSQVDFYPPEAASLMKAVDYPISHMTGMPDIRIPIHSIKAGSLTLPVELSYHPDSYAKANQSPGAAGAGWSLSTELQISRAINGIDDLNFGYCYNYEVPANYSNAFQSRSRTQMKLMAEGLADEEPDKFYYQLLGKSGSFYFQKQSNGSFIPVPVPYNGVKINYNFTTRQFTIIDTDGTTYVFSTTNTEWSSNLNNTSTPILAWKCEAVKNAAGVQEMNFTWSNSIYNEIQSFTDRLEIHDEMYTDLLAGDTWGPKCSGSSAPFWQVTGPKIMAYGSGSSNFWAYSHLGGFDDMGSRGEGAPSQSIQYVYKRVLTGISFRGGSIVFNYINRGELTSLQIRNGDGTTIKNVTFYQSYPVSGSGSSFAISNHENSRKLDSIHINDQVYSFEYAGTRQYGDVSDYWGYATDPLSPYASPNVLLPDSVEVSMGSCEYFYDCYANDPMTPLNHPIFLGRRTRDLFDLVAHPLATGLGLVIRYPTGGRTEFIMERNRFRDPNDGSVKGAGGERIARIRSYDGLRPTPISEKIYKYGPDEDGTGIIKVVPSTDPYTSNCMLLEYNTYITGTGNISTRKRTYFSRPTGGITFSNGAIVNYNTVTEYNSDMGTLTGKTVYKYDFYWYTPEYMSPTDPYPFERNDWDRGMPDSVIHYKYQNGQFVWVKKKNMDYNTYTSPYKIFQGKTLLRGNYYVVGEANMNQDQVTLDNGNFEYKYSAIDVGTMQLTHEDETIRDDNGNTLANSTNYYYTNPDPSVVTRKETTGSDGITTIEHITYPTDYAPGGFITPLINANIVSVPVEKLVRRNGKIISGETSTYNANGTVASSYQIESQPPLDQSAFRMSNKGTAGDFTTQNPNLTYNRDANYKEKVALTWDSYLNLLQVSPTDNRPSSYLWGYNRVYPVAQVVNAQVKDVFYTSFEEGNGNSNDFKTGSKSKAGGFSTGLSNLTNGNYVLSWWTLSGGNWTLQQNTVAVTNGAYTIDLPGQVDEVRFYPEQAVMSTYTYAPLVGITSQCDANNRVTYYEYDGFGRLQRIRDQDNNILKTFDYKYRVQQ